MSVEIAKFRGKFSFLSNFYPAQITYNSITGPTLEHVYQAAKARTPAGRRAVLAASTAGVAKLKGRQIAIRDDWDDVKVQIMRDLLRVKFAIPDLRWLLLDTGDATLIHGNHHRDVYWGVCSGKGLNKLGLLLMKVRDEIRSTV